MNETQLAWAAGFIDGEGYIGVTRSIYRPLGRYNYHALISVGQSATLPLEDLASWFGGTVSGTKRGYHQWRRDGKYAIATLRAVLPYLRLKKRQAELVIEFWELTQRDKLSRFRLVPEDLYRQQQEYHVVIRGLNNLHKHHSERLNEKAPVAKPDDATVRSHGNQNHESDPETGSPTVQ